MFLFLSLSLSPSHKTTTKISHRTHFTEVKCKKVIIVYTVIKVNFSVWGHTPVIPAFVSCRERNFNFEVSTFFQRDEDALMQGFKILYKCIIS